ncbi:hypothetical protein LINPERPRIM_LOCUS22672 [Linum perenne]
MTLMDGHELWPPSQYSPVLPPHIRKTPGRPKKNRVHAVEERQDGVRRRKRSYTNEHFLKRDRNDHRKMSRVGRVMTCSNCHKEGHKRRRARTRYNMSLFTVFWVICHHTESVFDYLLVMIPMSTQDELYSM